MARGLFTCVRAMVPKALEVIDVSMVLRSLLELEILNSSVRNSSFKLLVKVACFSISALRPKLKGSARQGGSG